MIDKIRETVQRFHLGRGAYEEMLEGTVEGQGDALDVVTRHIARVEAENRELRLMFASAVLELGGELRISRRTIIELSSNDVLERTVDPKTGAIRFRLTR